MSSTSRRSHVLLVAAVVACSVACRRSHDDHGDNDQHDQHDQHDHPRQQEAAGAGAAEAGEHGHGAAAGDEPDVVRVAPDMLRDLRVTTAKAERRAAGEGVTLLGELRVNDDAYAEVAAAIPARIRSVSAGLGDKVRAGQALADVESAEVGRVRAELLHARARVDLTSSVLERKRPLAADNVVPAREIQETEAELRAAEAALQAARAALLSFGVSPAEVDKTADAGGAITLRAPIDGTVIERRAVRGARVDAEHTLFRIADERSLWLVVHAFERDAVRVAQGSEARISFPALPGEAFSGVVTNIGREVEPSSRTIPVRIDVKNQAGALRPGMSASAWVPLGDAAGTAVVAIPLRALQRIERDWVVFVPLGGANAGTFAVKRLGRGRDLGNEVEIVSGLEPGDEVVVEGAFLLKAEVEKAAGGGEEHPH
ncbi:MAG: efflux RND transporter periplasmic adaptor subunit [Deltaproteobacteria bacterium]|nr:efflux RND transporter periplasmic adaptor subunit [Deltaproteobacteria bacterium]